MMGETTSQASIRLRLLGGFDVLVGDRPVPASAWRQRRAAAIVKLLALAPAHRLHREHLMDILWPELDLDAQANNLRQMLHHARRQLEAAGMPHGLALARDGEAVVLAPPTMIAVDARAFEGALAQAWRALSPATAQAALALYGGDLLPDDRYEEWAEAPRSTLRLGFLALLARLGHLHAERDELPEAIGAFQRLVATEPTQEEAHIALMRLYARTAQRQLALAQYDRLVATLAREQDAAPSRQARELAGAIEDGRYPEPTSAPAPDRRAQAAPPAPLSTLIGREREIAEIRQLLSISRLVTLTGPGGIGKTRLAIAVARATGDRAPDDVCFVDLTLLRDPDLVVPAIAQALGLREAGGLSPAARLDAFLHDKHLLIVLDNVEQVAAAAAQLAALLERATAVRVLATSRERLALRGEREYPVPPLAVGDAARAPTGARAANPPAVALFAARAREARADFALSAENAGTVAAICRQLNGLPLAIELAAARSSVLSPQALLARLGRPLAVLLGGAPDLPERQRTMRTTIAWSHDLLDAGEQALFRLLGVFSGGWSLEAAEAVAPPGTAPGAVADRLGSLVAKNLVTRHQLPDGELRFGMLETIREFATERLGGSGEAAAARDRHAAHFVALAERVAPQLERADQVRWLGTLDRDADNLRAALAWLRGRKGAEPGLRLVIALKLYWFMRGQMTDGYEQTIGFAELAESAAFPLLCSDALNAAGFLMRETADYERAFTASRASLALSHRLGDRQRAADALANLGYVALQQGKYDDARDLFRRSLATYRELGNRQGLADSLSFLALTAFYQGDLPTARRLNEESLAIWLALDDWQATVWARTRLGGVLLQQGADAAAYREFMHSLLTCKALDFRYGISWAFDGLAHLAAARDAPHLALRLAAAAAAIRETDGIKLPTVEQEEVDRLLDRLRATVGVAAFVEVWSRRHQWTLDELLRAIGDTLHTLRSVAGPPYGAG